MKKLSTIEVDKQLINKQFFNIIVEECVDSTNNVIKSFADKGEAEGKVVIAFEQTQGKGRLGRKFYSPGGHGIYMSILLRPNKSVDKSLVITSAAALAVCKAIREMVGLNVSIKWVNDIILNEKKLCGILTEGRVNSHNNSLEYAVLGIGINMSVPDGGYPKYIKEIAIALEQCDAKYDINKLIAKILDNFYFYYNDIDLQEDVIRYEYIGCCSSIGREVDVISGVQKKVAKVIGISEDMGLIIKDENGIENINSGEISIRHLRDE